MTEVRYKTSSPVGQSDSRPSWLDRIWVRPAIAAALMLGYLAASHEDYSNYMEMTTRGFVAARRLDLAYQMKGLELLLAPEREEEYWSIATILFAAGEEHWSRAAALVTQGMALDPLGRTRVRIGYPRVGSYTVTLERGHHARCSGLDATGRELRRYDATDGNPIWLVETRGISSPEVSESAMPKPDEHRDWNAALCIQP